MNISAACYKKPLEAAVLAQKTLSSGMTESLHIAANNIYHTIAGLMAAECTDADKIDLSAVYKYLPHASSISLAALEDKTLIHSLLSEVSQGAIGCFVRKMLQSDEVLCDLDQAWIRRQYAPHLYPMQHAPHGWHQDGALGFDFLKEGIAKSDTEALLPTVTCWIALTECGVNAPGLEFVCQIIKTLLLPGELTNNRIDSCFSANLFWKPQMAAGDALVFLGGTLHRTHVLKQMQSNRTSVELRFVAKDNIPQRLANDYFVPLPSIVG